MSRLGTLIRGLRMGKQLDLPRMAYTLGTSPRRLELVEFGAVFPPAGERRAWAARLGFADLVDFDRHWRDGWARVTRAHRDGWVPIINKAPAGAPVEYEEFGIDSGVGYEYVPRSEATEDHDILFAVIVIGDSMSPAYCDGDLVIFRPVRPDEQLPDGSPVFVRFTAERDHTCTFKNLFRRDDGQLELHPENPVYPIVIVPPENIDRMSLAIERRARFWAPQGQQHVHDEYAQEFPGESYE
jgi:SOS-response transcriptional repressor LexA